MKARSTSSPEAVESDIPGFTDQNLVSLLSHVLGEQHRVAALNPMVGRRAVADIMICGEKVTSTQRFNEDDLGRTGKSITGTLGGTYDCIVSDTEDKWRLTWKTKPSLTMGFGFGTKDDKACWTGTRWVEVTDRAFFGDMDLFKHQGTLLLLFESQWTVEIPEKPTMKSLIAALTPGNLNTFSMGVGTGKTSMAAYRPSGQHIGRGGRGITPPVVFFDYETSYLPRKLSEKDRRDMDKVLLDLRDLSKQFPIKIL